MRFVFLNQFFWPDAIATGQVLTDVARELAAKHEVIVICGNVGVRVSEAEMGPSPAVKIIRIENLSFGHKGSTRIASYLLFVIGSIARGIILRRPDSFITLTTPPILPVVGALLSFIRGTRHIIWEMDVYPDIANDIGYFKIGGALDRISGMILDWSRRRADSIIVLGEDMKTRLISRGISEAKINVAENWADGAEIKPYPLPSGPLVVHYSGNFGLAHETETITSVIGRLRNHPDFKFVFVGGGPRRPKIEEFCRSNGIDNVEFRPYCSRSDLGRSLAEGHLGLVTQLPETLGSIVPSKIYGIMAAGRPLLYIGPDGSTPARHIEGFQCGWHIQPGDSKGLESLLMTLSENRELISLFGSRARIAFEQNFNRAMGISRVLRVLDKHPQVAKRNTAFAQSVRGDRL